MAKAKRPWKAELARTLSSFKPPPGEPPKRALPDTARILAGAARDEPGGTTRREE